MSRYIAKRLLGVIPTLFVITILVFCLLEVAPGDAATALVSPNASAAEIEMFRTELGLDKPAYIRYWYWLREALHGNLGYSYISGMPVAPTIMSRLPATLELAAAALLISTILGIVFGMISARKQGSFSDYFLSVSALVWISVPQFFIALLGLYVFGAKLELVPIGGRTTPGVAEFWDRMHHLVLPAITMGLCLTPALMRYTRSSMLDQLGQPYVDTAKSKGLSEKRIYYVHALRNALTPILVLLCFRLPALVGGSVFIETLFSWPGMGTLFLDSVHSRDYPMILGVLLITASAVLVTSVLVDIVTALVDPRIRYE